MSFPPIVRRLFGLGILTSVTSCSPAAPHPGSPFDLAPAEHHSAPSSAPEAWHGSTGHGSAGHGDGELGTGDHGGNPGLRDIGPNARTNGFSASTNDAAPLGGPGS